MTINLSALQKQRRDSAANWTAENPTLLAGEIGIESDTGYWKVGDGSTAWTSLAYVSGLGAEIPVDRLADGTAGQIIQTDSAGTGVEWSSTANLPLGSASAPAYRFQGDANTGIYSPGADQVAISTNGTGRLFVDSSGRVGVGSDNNLVDTLNVNGTARVQANNARLNVRGDAGSNAYIQFSESGVADRWSFGVSPGDGSLIYKTGASFTGTERLRVTSDGKLGVGTSTPSSYYFNNLVVGGTSGTNGITISSGTADTGVLAFADGTSGTDRYDGYINYDHSNQSMGFFTNTGNRRMTIDSAGRLGLGSSTPAYKLTVSGGVATTGIVASVINPVSGGNSKIHFTDDATYNWTAGTIGNAFAITPAEASTSAGTPALYINSSSRVGIGTTSPSVSLSVASSSTTGGIELAQVPGNTTNSGRLFFSTSAGSSAIGGDSGALRFFTGSTAGSSSGSEVLRIDSSGRLLVGTSSGRNVGGGANAIIQAETTSENGISFVAHRGTSTSGSIFVLAKSRGTAAGSSTIVANNDELGAIRFAGADGTDIESRAASIAAFVDGTPGANDMPGRLTFSTTADGASSPTERMRIDSQGRVGIGTASPSTTLDIGGANSGAPFVTNPQLGIAGDVFFEPGSGNDVQIFNYRTTGMAFGVGGAEKARIDSSGRLLVGTSSARTDFTSGAQTPQIQLEGTTAENSCLSITRNSNDSGTPSLYFGKSRGTGNGGTTLVANGDTIGNIEFQGADGVDLVRAAYIRCQIDGTPGASDMPGRLVFSTTADGASSPTERMRIDQGGSLLIGTLTNLTTVSSSETGTEILGNGKAVHIRDGGTVMTIGRQSSDGTLVEFKQAGSLEGTISVSGTTVSYNGAHLSRWSQLTGINPYDKTARPEILRGTVMSNLDEMCDWTCPTSGDCQDNEQLNKTEISSVDDDPNVAGVFQSWDDDDDTWVNDFYLAMTGDFVIRIAAGTTVQRGDLLCSAGDGTARPQGDRYLKDSTIAKVTSTAVSCTHPDGSYCVPCVLMAC